MRAAKGRSLLVTATIGLAAFFVLMILLQTLPVLAQGADRDGSYGMGLVQPAQPPPSDDWILVVVFTDPAAVDIFDLSGNLLGQGEQTGQVRCKGQVCNHDTHLQLHETEYTYRFETREAFDPVEERAVVSGRGTIANGSSKERFQFTAIVQNNRDGTIGVRYEASRPDASFVIPRTAGRFESLQK